MTKCDTCSAQTYKELWEVKGYRIVKCTECGLVYAQVRPDEISDLYEMDYYKTVYPDYESDRNIHERNNIRVLEKIEAHFRPGRMIEVGSAFGFFLDAATKRGWKASGYEMSVYASGIARQKYHCDVRGEDFLTAEIQDSVDVVCMFDTIEHLLAPSSFVERACSMLKKDGGLVVTTGDLSSLMARVTGKNWRMIEPPLHVYYYSRETLTRLLRQHGFEVLSVSHESKYQNLNSIFTHVFGVSKEAVPQIPIPVNLGDIMLVIAKKT